MKGGLGARVVKHWATLSPGRKSITVTAKT
jgi:hypothetical protein